ncbi:Uncharacterized protein TCM_007052 [Theobroma cacao]|uniref:FAR1 domain-containing protein n=1 Tax=Theobroma cacao TaxID=3641 RepID=A0A061DZX4_THECC|nr:Uncharacterized protein TCM_007052 [Theobroma cacao]
MENKENNLLDAKYLHKLSKDDILGLEFDDLEDVYEFYKAYACAMGFGVRKGGCRRNKDGIEVMKHFACSKEGHKAEKREKLENRAQEPKRSSRIDCKANIRVILNKDIGKWIPLNLIMKRWTKNAKDDAPAVVDDNVDPKYQTILRYASLSSHCNRLCHVASQFVETFNKARSEIASLTRRYEEMCKVNTDGISNLTEHVRDPTRVKVKGKVGAKSEGKKKPRKCGNCRMEGHTRNKCPQLELTLCSLDSSSCLLDDNDVDVYERNKEIWPSQLGTLFGGDSSEEE